MIEVFRLKDTHIQPWNLLTAREKDVCALITKGTSNKNIAQVLGISERTVEGHRAKILRKFRARNTTELLWQVLDQQMSHRTKH